MHDLIRDPELEGDWGLSVLVVVLLAGGVALASAFGDPERAVFTILPFLIAVVGGLAAGWRAGLALSLITVGLVVAASLFASSPLTAALGFAAVSLWVSVPSRWQPSQSVGPTLMLVYLIAVVTAVPGAGWGISLLFALAAVAVGMLVVALVTMLRRTTRAASGAAPLEAPPNDATMGEAGPPSAPWSWREVIGPVLAAVVMAALTFWHSVSPGFQMPVWVLLTFMMVYQPVHPETVKRSLLRVIGTIIGFAGVLVLGLLPGPLSYALGIAAIVPAIAYLKRSYLLSVAAGAVMVVTIYGAPQGQYLSWGIARTLDTAVGAALALGLSLLVRKITPAPAGAGPGTVTRGG
ncbi:FUSC family protein [Propionicimonas sp. T2.31MG-18]|uniref:FUSC family protein n=1 Tax=Propionicimonas sp. T2.31MG-18 TaxID=3157620 RepID=UPI00367156B3